MKPAFLDTVGLLALWDRSDQWHVAASTAYEQLKSGGRKLSSTTFVLLECGNASGRRPYREKVSQLRVALENSGLLVVPSAEDWQAAWQAYDRREAAGAGIVDHVSFVVMRRLDLVQAFTNDAHFRTAGFETLF